MDKNGAAVLIVLIVGVVSFLSFCVYRDMTIHMTAFENGYSQQIQPGSGYAKWVKP